MSIYRKPNKAHEADLDPDLFSQVHGTLTYAEQAQTRSYYHAQNSIENLHH